MKTYVLLILFFVLFLFGCGLLLKTKKTANNCEVKPETGQCRAAFKKYYFDQTSQTCQEFTWGGCGGLVPFETLEDCRDSCE